MNYNDKVMDVIDEVKKVVIGKDVCIAKIMAALLHLQMQWGSRTRESSLHRMSFREI